MTAKDVVIEHARDRWTEEQAERALRAAEGGGYDRADRVSRHKAALERAAAVRARQTDTVDAAALVRESREELERRGS